MEANTERPCHRPNFRVERKFKRLDQKILNDPGVKDCFHKLHEDFVLDPTDEAANDIIVICKKYYIETFIKELWINSSHQINSSMSLLTTLMTRS